MIEFTPTPEQVQLRRDIVAFCRAQLNDGIRDRDRDHAFPAELWSKCGAMGLQGLPVPPEFGGIGLDPLSTALAMEAFGYGCEDGGLVFAVGAHLLACIVPIWKHGCNDQRRALLPALASGRRIAVNAMSEPGSGSDAFAMTTVAVPDGDGFRLRGTKTFASNGPVADLAVTYARTDPERGLDGGITAFAVERSHGFQVGQTFAKMGLHTAPLSELVFDDVWVPTDAVIGQIGGGGVIFAQSMTWERVCLSAAHVGAMDRLLEVAVSYARTRAASGRAIGKFQAVAHRIADMKARLEAARLLTYRAASRLDQARDADLDASIAKLFVSESLVRNALDTVRTLGGYGYMQEYDVERAFRDGVGGLLYSGTSDIQRNIIARWLGL